MRPIRRKHLVATIFPASTLELVRQRSELQDRPPLDEVVFLTGAQPITARRVQLIAEEFAKAGKSIRVTRTL